MNLRGISPAMARVLRALGSGNSAYSAMHEAVKVERTLRGLYRRGYLNESYHRVGAKDNGLSEKGLAAVVALRERGDPKWPLSARMRALLIATHETDLNTALTRLRGHYSSYEGLRRRGLVRHRMLTPEGQALAVTLLAARKERDAARKART